MAIIEGFVPGKRDWERIGSTVRGWESGLPPDGPGKRPLRDRDFVPVLFRNNSGEAIPAFAAMRVTSLEDDEGVKRFVVAKSNTTLQRNVLVNTSGEEIPIGHPGWGTWLWHSDKVLYDDANTPAFGEGWGPQPSSWKIAKGFYGFTIDGQPTGGTTDLVFAKQEVIHRVLCKADGTIAGGGTGDVNVYTSAEADSGFVITGGKNRTGVSFEDTTWGTAYWLGNQWFYEPWECPA